MLHEVNATALLQAWFQSIYLQLYTSGGVGGRNETVNLLNDGIATDKTGESPI
ncbi:hypothetical protein K469DRAFT_699717 [Zopfia rhizophila CBS 207.26]|uniref:Uncharacterized protein n=1 Tax=Zopfia rhizophila CBS 207.26 TaxID=1314779 RepID=A0A6A6DP22_9PEZI|nr:hypothetical protein K469DRAFT_715815 [Zopfia rhizophila CBS 207.26]KAF2187582.1 hypothetical protein K469DRAFT_704483 [Zopfia rhizophila CBS 207.26]KAF2190118.1 hypothetical protein K469DRAFT_699717 [Zopfia rhizophila CBS 207.26]